MADFSDSVQQPVDAPPASVNLNDTGQSMLNSLKDFMDRMGDGHLGYLYNYWNKTLADNHQGGHSTPTVGNGEEEKSLLPELYKMGFGYMDGSAKRLDNLTSAGGALGNLSGGLSSSISGAWSDKAGQAASGKFGDLQKAANDYQDTAKKLAAAMHSTWSTTRQAVDTLSKFPSSDESPAVGANGGQRFMGLYGTEDKWNVGQWSNNIDGLRGLLGTTNPDTQTTETTYIGYNDTTTQQVGGSNYTWADLSKPGSPKPSSVHGDADNHHADEVIRTMNDFNNNYDAVVRNFRAQIKATHDSVHNQMVTLQNTIKEQITNTDPFGQLSVGAPPPAPSQPNQPSQPSHNGGGGGNYTGGGGGGGGGGSSSGTSAASFTPPPTSPSTVGAGGGGGGGAPAGGGGAGAMPTIPPISTPVGSTSTGTSAYPGTGTEMPGSSTGMPGTSTGMPGTTTGMPGTTTGMPGTTTGMPGANPETLTVQSGGSTIGMSTPDSQGNMQLTVHDASGQAHTYDVGFGQGTGAAGTPVQPGAAGDPSQLAIQHITPGADGHAVIHDGNMTITASEPQGQNGPVQVTVDDGSGHPSTYTLGGGQAGDPSSTVGAAMGGTGGATSASAWLSPDAVNQAQTTAATTPDVGGTVSGHVGDMSSLTGAGGGVGGGLGGGGHAGLAVSGIGGGAGGGAIHSVLGGSVDHTAGEVSGVGDVGLANTNVNHAAAAGAAGMATGAAGGAAGGSPMMGGMGGMGGGMGGGQGQDTERGPSQWRTQGHLFDNVADDNPASGFSGVLGEETGQQGR